MNPTTMDRPVPPGGAPTPMSPPPEPVRSAESTRDTLFGPRALKLTPVDVPGYGTARVTSLKQGQWEDLNTRHEKDGKTDTSHGYMSEAVAAALVEADGTYVFEDVVAGGQKVRELSLPAVAKLFEAVASQSGLTAEAREALGKGSGPTPAAGG